MYLNGFVDEEVAMVEVHRARDDALVTPQPQAH